MGRINIVISDSLLKRIDRMAKKENKSRSDFLRTTFLFYEKHLQQNPKKEKS
ncbi:MAG: ribbon-helix-helix protein, CopG family [Nitrospirae bacterium]|jgi:metal-responsive CopG/Arc/MetJ family transcriptional regulator|nr:ribbon-helix-helix protein, CopG family [Nitrospirota bacterium]